MITGTTLDKLAAMRREHCVCGFVGNTPAFHEDNCPFKALAEEEIKKAEMEVPTE